MNKEKEELKTSKYEMNDDELSNVVGGAIKLPMESVTDGECNEFSLTIISICTKSDMCDKVDCKYHKK